LKNRFSHLHDRLQYLALKAGFGRKVLTGGANAQKATKRKVGGWNPFSHMRGRRR